MKQQKFFREINSDLKKIEKELDKFLKVDDPLFSQTCLYLLQAGGKRIRPGFTLLAGKFFDYRLEKLMPVAMALEIIHMATLIHDDVVDASLTRRGRPTLAAGWGNTVSVATGDYLFAKALELIVRIDNSEISSILADVCIEMCQGEIQQIKSAFDTTQTYKQYYYRIQRKTAQLISLCCKLGAKASGAEPKQVWLMSKYGNSLGIAFQMVDDILDLTADPKALGKPIGGDIRQGIITLPMIFALKDSPQKDRLNELLGKQIKSEAEVEECITLIIQSGGIEKSRRIVESYITKSKNYLAGFPDIPAKEALIELAKYMSERNH
ncbi:polyprenyl synthetase family protein [Dehalobacter sp. DCM]|uniref:polyprenyl synthetase family protein n=1 Tax=Dehalobacter sp. DCM TaxID=2907827 RepID=UPI00308151A7|nr:polyprenyl synthetase family protein [Dehalobacter sp. DCM]